MLNKKMNQEKKTTWADVWGRQISSLSGLSHFAIEKSTQHIQVPGSPLNLVFNFFFLNCSGTSQSFNINFSTPILHTSCNLQGNISLQRYSPCLYKGLSHVLVTGGEISVRPCFGGTCHDSPRCNNSFCDQEAEVGIFLSCL